MASKRQKTASGKEELQNVYLVTKMIDIEEVDDFGDLEAAYPDNDYVEQTEELVREEIEEKIHEIHKVVFGSYDKAFNVAKELFIEAKTYVNSLGNESNDENEGGEGDEDDEPKERDVDLDPSKFIVDPMLIENIVTYNVPMDGQIETEETNLVSAHIKITIIELQLDL